MCEFLEQNKCTSVVSCADKRTTTKDMRAWSSWIRNGRRTDSENERRRPEEAQVSEYGARRSLVKVCEAGSDMKLMELYGGLALKLLASDKLKFNREYE
jgi:hypothetical protein